MLYPARAIVKELLWPVDKILYVTEVLGKFYPLTKISTAPHAYMSTRLIKIPQLRELELIERWNNSKLFTRISRTGSLGK